jgi:predicted LPLAT superfamily acyltransferase
MSEQWSTVEERGAYWGVWLVAAIYRVLGRTVCEIVLVPVAAYFFVTGAAQRRASRGYLERMWKSGRLARRPGLGDIFRHFLAFSYASLDKLAAWTGRIKASDVDGTSDGLFDTVKKASGGAVILTAHIGNPEIVRAIATVGKRRRVNVLVHTLHAERFNRVIARFSPDSPVRLLQVTDIDVGAAMRLSEAVEAGEWVVIAADRVAPTSGEASAVAAPFLGEPALFPTGPMVLASALKQPVYTLFCAKAGKRYRIAFELFAERVETPRGRRAEAIRGYVALFARRMEEQVALSPYQWFNFYDYWRTGAADTARPGVGAQRVSEAG